MSILSVLCCYCVVFYMCIHTRNVSDAPLLRPVCLLKRLFPVSFECKWLQYTHVTWKIGVGPISSMHAFPEMCVSFRQCVSSNLLTWEPKKNGHATQLTRSCHAAGYTLPACSAWAAPKMLEIGQMPIFHATCKCVGSVSRQHIIRKYVYMSFWHKYI